MTFTYNVYLSQIMSLINDCHNLENIPGMYHSVAPEQEQVRGWIYIDDDGDDDDDDHDHGSLTKNK